MSSSNPESDPLRVSGHPAPDEVSYVPVRALPYWGTIGRFAVDAAVDSAAELHVAQRDLLVALTPLVLWCWQTAGMPLERERVFAYSTIDRFIRVGLPTHAKGSRATIRSRLLRISESLSSARPRHIPRVIGKSDRLAPYETEMIAELYSWARQQSTDGRRNSASRMLSLAFGAGLSTREILSLRTGDVLSIGDDVLVHVTGERGRIVPVSQAWRGSLTTFEANRDAWVFRPGRTSTSEGQITDFVARSDTVLDVRPARMRSTWILDRLREGLPALELLELSGLQNFAALDRYRRYLESTADDVPPVY